ncbi:MAG TPA: AAA family ATPase [Pseudomonadales bacterium]
MSTRAAGRSGKDLLVGRQRELDAFHTALDAVEEGRACVIQVVGETGIGRTRLLHEFAERAEASNALSVLTRPGPAHAEPLAPLRRPELGVILPRLAAAVGRALQEEDGFGRLLQALVAETEHAPVWLLIDDVHFADEATRALVERLMAAMRHGSLRDARLGLVLSRVQDRAGPDAAPRVEPDSPERRWHLTLERLGIAEVREWLQHRFGLPPEQDLLGLLMQASAGVPLLICELLTFLERSGYLEQHEHRVGLGPRARELALPRDLNALLQGKVGAISGPCRRAITLASFLGDEFDTSALAELLGQRPEGVAPLLEEAAAASLVERRQASVFGFKHPAARELLYGGSDQRSREETHLQICQQLIDELGEQAEAHALTITHHLLRAGRRADPALVLRFAARAGEMAFEHHSYYLAGRYFEAAAQAGVRSLAASAQADLFTRAGEAFQRWSDGARSTACFEQAARLYEEVGDLPGYARALTGLLRNHVAFGESRDDAAAIAARLQALLAALPEDCIELKVRVHDTLAVHYHDIARFDVAEAYAQTATTLAQQSADPALRCIPVTSLALAQMEQLRLTEARTAWLQGLSYDRAAGAVRYEGLHLQRLPVPLYCLGEIAEAARYNQISYQHNEAIGNTGELCLNLTVDVMIANLRGRFDDAIATGWSAMELMETTRYLWPAPALIGALACALTMRERFDDAERVLAHLSTDGLTFADAGPYRRTASRLAELVAAHREPAAAPAAAPPPGDRRTMRGVRLGSLARLCAEADLALLQNRPARLSGIHDALEFVDRRGIVLALGWCCSVPRSLAVSTALRNGLARAERHFQQAERFAERAGAPLELGRVMLYRGLAGLACEAPPDQVQMHLERARQCFQDFGVSVLERLAADALSRCARPTPVTKENNDA